MLNPAGMMAMQIPNPSLMPIQTSLDEVAKSDKWKNYFAEFNNGLHLFEPEYYYDLLMTLTDQVDIWETHYHHIMPSYEAIIEWYSSTGMKPYLEKLDSTEHTEFKNEILHLLERRYKKQSDGNILFPFRRIFFTITKK